MQKQVKWISNDKCSDCGAKINHQFSNPESLDFHNRMVKHSGILCKKCSEENQKNKKKKYEQSLKQITRKINDKEVSKFREENVKQLGLSGRNVWNNIDDLPLSDSQKKCVLEWLTQKLAGTKINQELDIWTYGKSYDPLAFNEEGNIAYSYVMNFNDGGRRHNYSSFKEVEDTIFEEFFEDINIDGMKRIEEENR